MGVFCFKCESSSKEKEDSEDDVNQINNNREKNFPKQYVDNNNFEQKDLKEEEETILKFDNDDEPKTNSSKDGNKHNNYNKSKSTYIKKKNNIEKKFEDEIIDENEKEEKIEKREDEEEKIKKKLSSSRKNRQFKTVKNPLELQNRLKDNIYNDHKNLELGSKSKSEGAPFQRRAKKSTTLMENSKILQQLFLAEMRIPISHELLVQQQKGNPNDKYIRGKKIGKGTFGTVYESKNIIFNNKVAMKIIPKDYHMDNLLIKNEIDILKKLSHPNIVRIYEFFESKNCFYIINEFCPNGELYNYINNSKLDEEQLSVIFYQVFSGLKYLHENNCQKRNRFIR